MDVARTSPFIKLLRCELAALVDTISSATPARRRGAAIASLSPIGECLMLIDMFDAPTSKYLIFL